MKKIIEWFIDNPVASNLLMILILFGGLSSLSEVDKQFFPRDKNNTISLSMNYPGAGPSEVETQLVLRLEEAIADLNGIQEINSFAREGRADMTIKMEPGTDGQRLVSDMKTRIDAITTFPVDAERYQIAEDDRKRRMVSVALHGDIDEVSLKELGQQIRDEMTVLSEVGNVELVEPRPYEVSIEVSESTMRRYDLRFDDVVNAIKNSSLNLPAGKLRTTQGDIQLQTRAQGYTAADFENIVLLSDLNGTQILLGDVAAVIDGFSEVDVAGRFNNQAALSLEVFVTSNPNVIKTSNQVRDFISNYQKNLPPNVELTIWKDMSVAYQDRIATLISNGVGGLLLVFIVLVLFLRPLLALWVCAGIAVAFMGALWMIPYSGASLNMVALFAFILILGIVVDDAIIVGESIYTHQQGGLNGVAGARAGAAAVLKPICFAVASTMIFFSILFQLPGNNGSPRMIAIVALSALCFSLIEVLYILPAHLAHMGPEKKSRFAWLRKIQDIREYFANSMVHFSSQYYRPFLERCVNARRMTLVSFIVVLMISIALVLGGWLQSSFFPRVPADFMKANITMPEGGSFSQVEGVLKRVEDGAKKIKQDFNDEYGYPVIGNVEARANSNKINASIELLNIGKAQIPPRELKQRWEEAIGDLSIAQEVDINFTVISIGKPVELILTAKDTETLRDFSRDVRLELAKYPEIYNVRDSLDSPRTEIQLKLKPEAETLDLTLADVARQVRRGFYGEEVQRIPRLREDVKVMVRYPEAERRSEDFLKDMRIRTVDGTELPFESVAELEYVQGYTEIQRIDRKRVSKVTADLIRGDASAQDIISAVMASKMSEWQEKYYGISVVTSGEQKEMQEFGGAMAKLLLGGVFIIYGLIAIAFGSYWKPLLVLSSIPFAFVGAILGHIIMDVAISMFSLIGIIAAIGVVVNDNLVLIDRVNRLREDGVSLKAAIFEGAQDRFRPIILTSITTLIGLMPIMLETSLQAKFLIPMVVSLAYGVVAATVVTLILVPVLYVSLEVRIEKVKSILSPKRLLNA